MPSYSSGDTALETAGDGAITLFAIPQDQKVNILVVTHTTANVPFELSYDNGNTWVPCNSGPNGASVDLRDQLINGGVKLRRIPGGTDVSGIYAWATAN